VEKQNSFRDMLAEKGIEATPEEAIKLYKATKRFVRQAKKMSMDQVWRIEKEHRDIADLILLAKET